MTPQEILQRHVWAGAMTRNADALVGLFAADGVLEAPLVPLAMQILRHSKIALTMEIYTI